MEVLELLPMLRLEYVVFLELFCVLGWFVRSTELLDALLAVQEAANRHE